MYQSFIVPKLLHALQFHIGDEVFLSNPRSPRQKVAKGNVSGLPGEHKFHFKDIPEGWLKVDVNDILHPSTALMFPAADPDMQLIEDAKGTSVVWHAKYIKFTT